jgi:hypothetical protein
MPFAKGQSGNPGGKRKALGLSRAVRKSEGLKSWAWLCKAGDGYVLERKEIGKDKDGNPIMVDVVPSLKSLLDVHRLKLAYTWGTPTAQGTDELEKRIEQLEERLKESQAWPAH